ncbi:MAG: hypothetical protein Q8N23_12905 [Archangium sp.]|nr:hypothetical protein [Archangium sp.]MDP3574508.1 hypothetical protein [Archangium sp.]
MKKLTALVLVSLFAACADIDEALARRLDGGLIGGGGGAIGGGTGGGTGGGNASEGAICRNGFCWEYPLPQGNDLKAVWGKSASDVWMVGSVGTVLHWNGTRLENHSPLFPSSTQLNSVWSNGDVVLVVGETQLSSNSGPMKPMRLLVDGGWVAETWNAGPQPELLSIRGNGLDIQAVGLSGVIARRSPTGVWQPRIFEQLPDASANISLTSIAFDDAGTCLAAVSIDLHGIGPCDGGALELTLAPDSNVAINGLWSTGPGIFHAGIIKQVSPSATEGQLWLRSADGGWAQERAAGTGCAAGFARGPVSVAYCGITELWQGTPPTAGPLEGLQNQYLPYNGLWTPADSYEGGWLVGGNGGMLRHQNGEWVQRRQGVGANFSGLWVDGQREVVVGDGSLSYNRSLGEWIFGGVNGSNVNLKDLWIAPDDTFRVYVGDGRRLFEGARGSMAQPISVPVDDTFQGNLNAVWGTSRNDLWAVGDEGEIWHRDAVGWSRNLFFPDGGPDLFDIDGRSDGSAYIVGQGCVVLRRDPTADGGWLNIKDPGCTDDLKGVWAAPPNGVAFELMAVGTRGDRAWQRSTTGAWSATDPKGRTEFHSVWGTAANNIYASGEDGVLSHFTGTGTWEVIETGTRWPLRSVRGRRLGTGETELYLIGENATILRALRP